MNLEIVDPRKNDKIEPYERETDQAASGYFRWFMEDSKAEFYGEFGHNDAKMNLRDLLTDSDHSRSVTLGFRKLFDSKRNNSQFEFQWEWTQMEQTGSRLIRNAGSWYLHNRVYHGYTNNGEVIGAGIGPGSNSQYFSVANHDKNRRIGFAIQSYIGTNVEQILGKTYVQLARGNDDFKYHEQTPRPNIFMNKKDLILRDNANNELQKILYKDAKKIGKY